MLIEAKILVKCLVLHNLENTQLLLKVSYWGNECKQTELFWSTLEGIIHHSNAKDNLLACQSQNLSLFLLDKILISGKAFAFTSMD